MSTRLTSQKIAPLPQRPASKSLEAHCQKLQTLHLRSLFSGDPKREQRLTAEAAGRVSDSDEGRWTIKAAIYEAVPAPVLTSALHEWFSSRRSLVPEQASPRDALPVRRPHREVEVARTL
jgi:hypothetical protein